MSGSEGAGAAAMRPRLPDFPVPLRVRGVRSVKVMRARVLDLGESAAFLLHGDILL